MLKAVVIRLSNSMIELQCMLRFLKFNSVTLCFVRADEMVPTSGRADLTDNRMNRLVQDATKIECDFYETANSRVCRLI